MPKKKSIVEILIEHDMETVELKKKKEETLSYFSQLFKDNKENINKIIKESL